MLGWIRHFLSFSSKHSLKSPLTTDELLKQRKLIIREVQLQYSDTQTFKINQGQLNVKVNEEGCISASVEYRMGILSLSQKSHL